MKYLIRILCITAIVISAGCGTTPKAKTYQTISALQTAVEISLGKYQEWAVVQTHTHPENLAVVQSRDAKVDKAITNYKKAAISALTILKLSDPPTETLLQSAQAIFDIINSILN
jgi:hypothetical protein